MCSGCYNKYPRLSGFNSTRLFLTVLEAGKCEIKVRSDLAPGESSLPVRHLAVSSHVLFSVHTKGESSSLVSHLIRTLSCHGGPDLNLMTSQRPHLRYHRVQEMGRASTYESGENTTQFIATTLLFVLYCRVRGRGFRLEEGLRQWFRSLSAVFPFLSL